MGLTLNAEQRLRDAGLIDLFEDQEAEWTEVAKKAIAFVKDGFPEGAKIRRDDVAKALYPLLEVNEDLKDRLDADKLRGKFWKEFFVDLIVDRTWDEINGDDDDKAAKA